jgi:hypothetical protein
VQLFDDGLETTDPIIHVTPLKDTKSGFSRRLLEGASRPDAVGE